MNGPGDPANGDADSTYPVSAATDIERQAKLKAVKKRLRGKLKVGKRLPAKPKLVWTADELAAIPSGGDPAGRHRRNRHASGERNPATSAGLRQRPAALRDDLAVDSHEPTIAARYESVAAPRRGPGRPGWTRDLFEERWREASAATHEPRTFRALAEHFRALDGFEGGISGDQLGKLRRRKLPE